MKPQCAMRIRDGTRYADFRARGFFDALETASKATRTKIRVTLLVPNSHRTLRFNYHNRLQLIIGTNTIDAALTSSVYCRMIRV